MEAILFQLEQLHAGFERKKMDRMPDLVSYANVDDNPDISEYIGRGDVNIFMLKNGNILSFNGRS
jgi:phospholipase A1